MTRLELSPKFSTIRSPPLIRETRRNTYLIFESGNKVPWVVDDWPDDDATPQSVYLYFLAPLFPSSYPSYFVLGA